MRSPQFFITWVFVFSISAPILSTLGGDAVPVLIWGGDAPASDLSPVNPFRNTSQEDFEKIVTRKVGDAHAPAPVLVFMRDNLCVEDFVQHKKDLMQLKKGGSLQYIPAVQSPLSVFENLASYNKSVEEEFDTVSDGQLIITKATDLDSVFETFNMIKESSPNLIAALTGRSCSYSRSDRVRRAVEVKSGNETEFIIARNESRLLARADEALFRKGEDEKVITLSRPTTVETTGNNSKGEPVLINAIFQDESVQTNLIFQLNEKVAGYWYMTKIEYVHENKSTTILQSKTEMVFPKGFSFHCSPTIHFINKTEKMSLNFTNLQIQMDVSNFTEDSYDCVGFTSIPIWSGIFVTFILAMIMIWGISMILDIRTMDRFDDSKGKTITVSAQE
ncbi:V-type proton ATPase subunit S1 [Diachasmimorpha longicaudata]|uniref:V-type proton ATPase subunit S1 n=1 Tax=Diachasmimorpha longicaudata TaxID=58733 RepID=UPI0030B8E9E8